MLKYDPLLSWTPVFLDPNSKRLWLIWFCVKYRDLSQQIQKSVLIAFLKTLREMVNYNSYKIYVKIRYKFVST
jgi:hypothetical protein